MTPSSSLLQRFLASAHQRLTDLLDEADALHQADDVEATIKTLGKTLHTLKGESRMLGVSEVSEIVHGVESMLFARLRAGTVTAQTTQLLQRGVDTALEALSLRQSGQQLPDAQLQEVLELLQESDDASAPAAPSDDAVQPRPSAPRASSDEASPSAPTPSPSRHSPDAPPAAREKAPTPLPKGATAHTSAFLQLSLEQLEQMTAAAADSAGQLALQQRSIQALQEHQRSLRSLFKAELQTPDENPGLSPQALEQFARLLAQSHKELEQLAQAQLLLSSAQGQLRDALKEARLQPLKSIFSAYPSFIRRLERETG